LSDVPPGLLAIMIPTKNVEEPPKRTSVLFALAA
jgi:hypothetical protein